MYLDVKDIQSFCSVNKKFNEILDTEMWKRLTLRDYRENGDFKTYRFNFTMEKAKLLVGKVLPTGCFINRIFNEKHGFLYKGWKQSEAYLIVRVGNPSNVDLDYGNMSFMKSLENCLGSDFSVFRSPLDKNNVWKILIRWQ